MCDSLRIDTYSLHMHIYQYSQENVENMQVEFSRKPKKEKKKLDKKQALLDVMAFNVATQNGHA